MNSSIDILSIYEYFKVYNQHVMGIMLKKTGTRNVL